MIKYLSPLTHKPTDDLDLRDFTMNLPETKE